MHTTDMLIAYSLMISETYLLYIYIRNKKIYGSSAQLLWIILAYIDKLIVNILFLVYLFNLVPESFSINSYSTICNYFIFTSFMYLLLYISRLKHIFYNVLTEKILIMIATVFRAMLMIVLVESITKMLGTSLAKSNKLVYLFQNFDIISFIINIVIAVILLCISSIFILKFSLLRLEIKALFVFMFIYLISYSLMNVTVDNNVSEVLFYIWALSSFLINISFYLAIKERRK